MSDDQETDGVLFIQEQPRTEIYWGENGHVVIKQFHQCYSPTEDEREPVHLFIPAMIPELVRHLQEKWRDYCEAHDLPLVPDALASLPPLPTPTTSPKKKRGPP